MLTKLNQKQQAESRIKIIIFWLEKYEKSYLTISDFFKKFKVPFSRSQFYIYRKRYQIFGESGLYDKRFEGGNKKTNIETEAFISGYIANNSNVNLNWLSKELAKRYNCKLCPSGISKVIKRLYPERERLIGRPEVKNKKNSIIHVEGLN